MPKSHFQFNFTKRLIKSSSALAMAYRTTYPFDGFEPITETNYLRTVDDIERDKLHAYANHPITRFAAFIGLSCRMPFSGEQSWLNIGRQFLGLPEHDQDGKTLSSWSDVKNSLISSPWYVGKAIIFTLLKPLLVVIPTLLINTVKLFTEFPLTAIKNLCAEQREKAAPKSFISVIATLGYGLSAAILFVTRAITSPAKNALSGYMAGRNLFSNPNSRLGKCIGVFLALLSVTISIAAYVTFPLAFKALIITHEPASIVNGTKLAIKAVEPVLDFIAKPFQILFKALGVDQASGSTIGMSVISGLMIAIRIPLTWLKDLIVNRSYATLTLRMESPFFPRVQKVQNRNIPILGTNTKEICNGLGVNPRAIQSPLTLPLPQRPKVKGQDLRYPVARVERAARNPGFRKNSQTMNF